MWAGVLRQQQIEPDLLHMRHLTLDPKGGRLDYLKGTVYEWRPRTATWEQVLMA